MHPTTIDVGELDAGCIERMHQSIDVAPSIESTIALNDVPETTLQRLNQHTRVPLEYILRLDGALISGSSATVWLDESVLAPTTLGRDWNQPSDALRPVTDATGVEGGAQLAAFRWGRNYYHWTYQCMGALLDLLDADIPVDRPVVTELNTWRRRTLELAGIDPDGCIELKQDENLRIGTAWISSLVSPRSVDRPTPRLISLFDRFSDRVCGGRPAMGPERVYISRADVKKRRIRNEDEVGDLVSRYGFDVVRTEHLSVDEQIALFRNVRHVIAPHGAGLVNLLYARRCQSVTEIMQTHVGNPCMFRICQSKGISHYTMQAGCAEPGERWRAVSEVDLAALEAHLDRLGSVSDRVAA